jgi:hypothetical protein
MSSGRSVAEGRNLLCADDGEQIPDESAARLSGMTLKMFVLLGRVLFALSPL